MKRKKKNSKENRWPAFGGGVERHPPAARAKRLQFELDGSLATQLVRSLSTDRGFNVVESASRGGHVTLRTNFSVKVDGRSRLYQWRRQPLLWNWEKKCATVGCECMAHAPQALTEVNLDAVCSSILREPVPLFVEERHWSCL